MYYKATVTFEGISDLLFGKKVTVPKPDDITHAQHEEQVWQEKAHVDRDGCLFIPAMSLKFALESAGKWLRLQIPGKGKSEFTKRFQGGAMVLEPMTVTVNGKRATMDNIEKLVIPVPSDGKRGGGKRVDRIFPLLRPPWELTGTIDVFDGLITEEVLYKHLIALGRFGGFGSMRIGNGGINGICRVANFGIVEQIDEQLQELEGVL